MATEKYVNEEVSDLMDLAKQIATAFGEFDWKHYTQAASMVLLAREVRALRHQAFGGRAEP